MNNWGWYLKKYLSGIKSFMSLIPCLSNKVMSCVSILNLKCNSVIFSLNMKKLKSLFKLCLCLLKCQETTRQLLLNVLSKIQKFNVIHKKSEIVPFLSFPLFVFKNHRTVLKNWPFFGDSFKNQTFFAEIFLSHL